MFENEFWKPVIDYEGLYSVSNLGRVRSEAREDSIGRTLPERILKALENGHGYLHVNLYREGQKKLSLIHRLVAITFIENPENKEQVNHIDNNPKNNRLENLEWATPKENSQHASKQGRSAGQKVAITEEVIQKMYQLLDQGLSTHKVAALIGVGQMTVWKYKQKRN